MVFDLTTIFHYLLLIPVGNIQTALLSLPPSSEGGRNFPSLKTFCEREVGEGEISILGFLPPFVFLPLVCVAGEGEFSSLVPLRPRLGGGSPKGNSCQASESKEESERVPVGFPAPRGPFWNKEGGKWLLRISSLFSVSAPLYSGITTPIFLSPHLPIHQVWVEWISAPSATRPHPTQPGQSEPDGVTGQTGGPGWPMRTSCRTRASATRNLVSSLRWGCWAPGT